MARKPLTAEQAERARQRAREWYAANKERAKENVLAWQQANPEKAMAYKRSYAEANKPAKNESARKYRAENPQKRCAWEHTRRARKRGVGGKLSPDLASRLMSLQRGKCACCKCRISAGGFHMDHVVPLSSGGSNTDDNIQLLCPTCNVRKSNKNPIEFMQQRGFLL